MWQRRRSDGAAMALRRRSDVAATSPKGIPDMSQEPAMALRLPLQNMRMRIRIKMPRLARKEAARTVIHDDGGAWDQFKEGYPWTRQNVSIKYHQLVGHFRCCTVANCFCAVGPSL